MLIGLSLAVIGGCFGGIAVSVRHAPAVSLALFGCLAAGIGAFAISSSEGPRGVPQDVAVWATVGLLVIGLVGLVVTRGRPPSRTLRRAAATVAVAAPAASAIFGSLLAAACPLYVTGRSYCHHSIDLLGGWVVGAAGLFLGDLLAIAVILWVSAVQARALERATASGPPAR